MGNLFSKKVISKATKELIGAISIDAISGECKFVSGPGSLEIAISETLAGGVHTVTTVYNDDGSRAGAGSRRVLPGEPSFEMKLDSVLHMSGFGLAEIVTEKGVLDMRTLTLR